MRKTVWLHNDQIDELVSILTTLNDETSKTILQELELAYARASSNRMLNKSFIRLLEKNNSLPIRLSAQEITFLLGLKLSESLIKDLEASND
jgi:hypothetical protein